MQTPLKTPSSAICAAGRFAADQRSASKQPKTPFCGRMEGSSAKAWRHGSRSLSRTSGARSARSEEHTSELQSLMRISYAVFCLKKKNKHVHKENKIQHTNKHN